MIRTRPFGRADVRIPEIGLGCYNLTADRGVDRDTALATLQRAYELGVRFFDTAPMYGAGECDELLGLAFGHLSADEVLIGAKLSGPAGEHLGDFSRDSVLRVFDQTLRALRRDEVFALQVHGNHAPREHPRHTAEWDTLCKPGMAFEALLELKEQGACRFIGATAHNSVFLAEAVRRFPLDVVEIASHYNITSHVAPLTLLPLTEERGLATVIANPIGGGRLVSLETYRAGAYLGALPVDAAVGILERMMRDTGLALYELALLYLLHDPRVTCVIPGPRNVAELEADVGVADRPPLADEQAAELARIGSRMLARKMPAESGIEVVGVPLRPEWLATSG
jgi:D-threo-aldose 1-dehydrogenase